jgi:hypothetical protein
MQYLLHTFYHSISSFQRMRALLIAPMRVIFL